MPYEKVGKNEPVCIADEAPFEIPDSWEWVRLGSVIELQSGQDMTPDKYNDNGDGIPYITGASNIIDGTVVINRWTTCGKAFAHRGDILLTCKGTVGTMATRRNCSYCKANHGDPSDWKSLCTIHTTCIGNYGRKPQSRC